MRKSFRFRGIKQEAKLTSAKASQSSLERINNTITQLSTIEPKLTRQWNITIWTIRECLLKKLGNILEQEKEKLRLVRKTKRKTRQKNPT